MIEVAWAVVMMDGQQALLEQGELMQLKSTPTFV